MSKRGLIETVSEDAVKKQQQYADMIKVQNTEKYHDKKPKYMITTWGCQMNEHDSENLSGMFEYMGYELTDREEDADVILYNTCAIRENAELKVYGNLSLLKHIKENRDDMIIGVCGCMMQQPHVVEELKKKYSHVDIVFGTHNIYQFPEMLYQQLTSNAGQLIDVWDIDGQIIEGLPTNRKFDVKSFVNIMYGCNNFCTYCIVPYTRGRERSREPKDILDEIRFLANEGIKEITLLGQNVNSYGKTLEQNYTFADLLRDVNDIDGIERIRFMSSHPKDLSDELIDAMAKLPKVCESLHLPIQSGSTRLLKKMNRHYSKEDYYLLVDKLRAKIPNIGFTTDIMVGFPGETEEDFLETMEVVERVQYDSAFTFLYSVRKGTPAEKMEDQVPEEVKKERFQRLLEPVNRIAAEKNHAYAGKVVEVLVESVSKRDETKLTGRTRENKLVNFDRPEGDWIGKIVHVKITNPKSFSLNGEMVSDEEVLG